MFLGLLIRNLGVAHCDCGLVGAVSASSVKVTAGLLLAFGGVSARISSLSSSSLNAEASNHRISEGIPSFWPKIGPVFGSASRLAV